MAKKTNTSLERIKLEYEQYYDLSSVDSPNDRANLEILIRNAVLIAQIQDQIDTLTGTTGGVLNSLQDIAKLNTALNNLIQTNVSLEKSLGIDRKSRRSEQTKDNPAEYIISLKKLAREFLESRIQRVYCPECKIMLMRFSPVHDHTMFTFEVQCTQCHKKVVVTRKEKDIFYDLKKNDKDWRRGFPIEIIQPKRTVVDVDDDVMLGEEIIDGD
jgi:hypothetical protein